MPDAPAAQGSPLDRTADRRSAGAGRISAQARGKSMRLEIEPSRVRRSSCDEPDSPLIAWQQSRGLGLPARLPSTCALEVEVLDERTIGRVRGAEDNDYTAGVICAKVARYAERVHHPDRLTRPLVRKGAKGSGEFAPISWDAGARPRRREIPARRAALRRAGGVALLLRRHHGPGDARRHQPPASRQELFRVLRHDLRQSRPGPVSPPAPDKSPAPIRARWRNPTSSSSGAPTPVNTQVNVMTHAVRARKERGAKIVAVDVYMNGTMEQADLPVLVRPGTDGALACAVMHCLFRDGKADWDYLERYTDAPRELEEHLRARRRNGRPASPAARSRRSRPSRGLVGATQARLFPPRLRLLALAQRRRQHACGELHSGGDRRLAARRRRGVPQQRRDLPLEQDHDRGARRARSFDPHARPVAHRRDSVRRAGRARGRAAGHRAPDPEHQSGLGRARSGARQARLCARGPVRLRARAIHDRDRAHGRRGAAGDHVPRARRHLSGRRPPIHPARAEADRAAGRMPLQSRGDLRARRARRRRASGLRHDARAS